jgi:hypothetical protein
MSTFTGQFRMEGDTESLPATVSVSDGMIKLTSRSHVIGEWPVSYLGIRESDRAVVLDVEGERVVLDLRDQSGFLTAAGLKQPRPDAERIDRKAGPRSRSSSTPSRSATTSKETPARPRPSLRARLDQLIDEVRPDLSEVRSKVRSLRGGPALWIGLAVFAAGVIFVPTLVVVVLTITGTAVTLVATFAYLDDSLRVRFPNRFPPVVVLAAGLAVLTLAVLVAVIR